MRLFSLLLCVMGLFGVFGCAAEAVEGRNRSPLTVHRSRASEGAEGVFAAAIAGRRPVGFAYSGVWRVVWPHRLGASAEGLEAGLGALGLGAVAIDEEVDLLAAGAGGVGKPRFPDFGGGLGGGP